jgi:hypothetical protein
MEVLTSLLAVITAVFNRCNRLLGDRHKNCFIRAELCAKIHYEFKSNRHRGPLFPDSHWD